MAIKLHKSIVVHPGPWLRRNFVEPYGLTQAECAERLGVTRVAKPKDERFAAYA